MVGFDGKLKCRKGKYTKENKQKRQPQLNPIAARGSPVSTEGPAEDPRADETGTTHGDDKRTE
jgi:hypothetical protein